jgi:hypothetical protein
VAIKNQKESGYHLDAKIWNPSPGHIGLVCCSGEGSVGVCGVARIGDEPLMIAKIAHEMVGYSGIVALGGETWLR